MAAPHQVWLLRHAETEWSRTRKHTGRTDVPLTDEGRAHARLLRERLAGHRFALVLTSPLGRARETAELAGLGDGAQPRDDLLEWDYGDYEGRTTKEIRAARPDWYLWRDGCPGGESPAEVHRRADAVVAEALRMEGDVALFAHGHVLRAIAARWLEQPVLTGGRLALDTGTISVLGFEREVRVVWRWNEAPERRA
jgi:broad specificity phosphatase PhoE